MFLGGLYQPRTYRPRPFRHLQVKGNSSGRISAVQGLVSSVSCWKSQHKTGNRNTLQYVSTTGMNIYIWSRVSCSPAPYGMGVTPPHPPLLVTASWQGWFWRGLAPFTQDMGSIENIFLIHMNIKITSIVSTLYGCDQTCTSKLIIEYTACLLRCQWPLTVVQRPCGEVFIDDTASNCIC